MEHKEYIQAGLNGDAPLKVIMRGSIEQISETRVGVVSLVYATVDKVAAEHKVNQLMANHDDSYYMVYSVPMDTDLTELEHYPSIAITKEDLL